MESKNENNIENMEKENKIITEKAVEKEERIRIGFTPGDINGIGYEIIIKALAESRIYDNFTPIVYGSSKIASYHRKTLTLNDFNFNLIKSADAANPKRPNIVNCTDKEVKIELGKLSPVSGQMALLSLDTAMQDFKNNLIDVLVTAPINKKSMQSENFKFPGHTEYLANKFNAKDYLMLMICDKLRIGVVTGHIPIEKISESITTDLIRNKILLMQQTLLQDFGIKKPRIAVLGLNPHASDNGTIGKEEAEKIIPVLTKVQNEGMLVYGPFAADGFFGSGNFNKFDGILAMYHDQGLLPFKLLAFENGVNFTAGLPLVRTSPAHGTAFDIAGKNMASANPMRAAIYAAIDIYNNRKEYLQLTSNSLGISQHQNIGKNEIE